VNLKLLIEQGDGQYFLIRDLNQYSLYDYLQHIAPKKWFQLIGVDFKLADLDLLELEQVLVRQLASIENNMSTSLLHFLGVHSKLNEEE
jgi:hypothetical protein